VNRSSVETFCVIALLGIALLGRGLPAHAQFRLFNSAMLDPSFCETHAVRQTVVYIDDSMMVEGQTAWVTELLRKLRASLAAGERTTVVQLSPMNGTSTEIWSGCWPQYTAAQKSAIAKAGPYFFSKNPLDTIAQQQGYFTRDFDAAVSRIYFQTKRASNQPDPGGSQSNRKQLLRALASDEGRFSNSATTVRAIVYSDMAENSDLGSAYQPVKPGAWVNYAEKLGTHLRKGVFYIFLGTGGSSAAPAMENAKAFWSQALRSMSAILGGYGSDLNVPNGIPVNASVFDATLTEGKQELDGKLSILSDADGNILDSWIGFSRLDIAGITGTFHCTSAECRLDAETTGSLTTDRPSEALLMSGTARQLSGTIGITGTNAVFPVTAALAEGGQQ
jgi:hypothetical protein